MRGFHIPYLDVTLHLLSSNHNTYAHTLDFQHSPTHTDNSLVSVPTPCPPALHPPHSLCEVYPADSLCSAQKCVETHPWHQHYVASAPPNTTHTHTHTFCCTLAIPLVQLSLCIRVNTCIFCTCSHLCLLAMLFLLVICRFHLLFL